MSWQIDPVHTLIEFTVKHMMITKVRGRFESFDGTLQLDQENPENSYVEGTIDVESIVTNDSDRDEHLRSADFFDVENHPKMYFKSTRIEQVEDDQFKVYGDMTIRGNTNEVVFDVTYEGGGQDPWGNQRAGFTATSTINRKDFGLTWNVALETGGWLVGDEVNISIDLQAVKQEETEEVGEPVPA